MASSSEYGTTAKNTTSSSQSRAAAAARHIDMLMARLARQAKTNTQAYVPYRHRKSQWEMTTQMGRLELDRLRDLLDMERRRNVAEREDRQREIDDRMDKETRWRRLMQKAGLAYKMGKFGAGWTWEDDAWADRLGVEMGYLKPWDRKFQVK